MDCGKFGVVPQPLSFDINDSAALIALGDLFFHQYGRHHIIGNSQVATGTFLRQTYLRADAHYNGPWRRLYDVRKLGQRRAMDIESVSTGSLSLDLALGIGGLAKGRIVEV